MPIILFCGFQILLHFHRTVLSQCAWWWFYFRTIKSLGHDAINFYKFIYRKIGDEIAASDSFEVNQNLSKIWCNHILLVVVLVNVETRARMCVYRCIATRKITSQQFFSVYPEFPSISDRIVDCFLVNFVVCNVAFFSLAPLSVSAFPLHMNMVFKTNYCKRDFNSWESAGYHDDDCDSTYTCTYTSYTHRIRMSGSFENCCCWKMERQWKCFRNDITFMFWMSCEFTWIEP